MVTDGGLLSVTKKKGGARRCGEAITVAEGINQRGMKKKKKYLQGVLHNEVVGLARPVISCTGTHRNHLPSLALTLKGVNVFHC